MLANVCSTFDSKFRIVLIWFIIMRRASSTNDVAISVFASLCTLRGVINWSTQAADATNKKIFEKKTALAHILDDTEDHPDVQTQRKDIISILLAFPIWAVQTRSS